MRVWPHPALIFSQAGGKISIYIFKLCALCFCVRLFISPDSSAGLKAFDRQTCFASYPLLFKAYFQHGKLPLEIASPAVHWAAEHAAGWIRAPYPILLPFPLLKQERRLLLNMQDAAPSKETSDWVGLGSGNI